MGENDKKAFNDMAARDKARFDKEMKSYSPEGQKQKTKRRRSPKDPNAPKKPISAFFWFSNDARPIIKSENPGCSIGDVAKECGKRWQAISGDAKAKYVEKAAADKSRYEKVQ
jgi:hypothetical protein